MGLISDYSAKGAADGGSSASASAPGATPSICPGCGQPMPAATIAKDAGFPQTPPAGPANNKGLVSGSANPNPSPPPKYKLYPLVGVKG